MRIGVGSRERKIGKRENVSRETFVFTTCFIIRVPSFHIFQVKCPISFTLFILCSFCKGNLPIHK